MDKKLRENLEKDLKLNAKALGIPIGSIEIFIAETMKSLEKSLKDKPVITEADLNRLLAKTLKKYNTDLAYVYQIRGKII